MTDKPISFLGGINTYTNPFNTEDGIIVHSVNWDSNPLGGKIQRPGYQTYLGTPDNGTVNSLFSWTKNDGATQFIYRASGSALYYSVQGTGDWTLAGNGTIGNGAHVSHAVLDNTLIVCDGVGSTRHTTNGTTFTNTTLAPVAVSLMDYQNRIYAAGTSSFLFYSTSGTATDWSADSSSIAIPGAGKLNFVYKASDRILTNKTSRIMHRWDGFNLVDMATDFGPSSPYSMGSIDDFRFYLNQTGVYMTNGGKPQLVSNPIQRQIYNELGSGIIGSQFSIAPGEVHKYDYFCTIGTITDDFTGITQPDAILKYDYKKNEFLNYHFFNVPTAYHSYTDLSGNKQLIFGDSAGQVYTYGGTVLTDNGTPIESSLILLIHANIPHMAKEWEYLEIYTNPGCTARIQYMLENTVVEGSQWYKSGSSRWIELGQLTNGYNLYRFGAGTRGRILYVKIYDSTSNARSSIFSLNYKYRVVEL